MGLFKRKSKEPQDKGLVLTSTEFQNGGLIMRRYTCDDIDMSPPFEWGNTPPGTKSFSLICDDPDAPSGTFVHWVLFNIPPNERILNEHMPQDEVLPDGSKQGKNDFGKTGYNGPCPPPGNPHRYFFKLYALDTMLELGQGATKADLENAMSGHILAKGELMGKYQRKVK
ncbi:YbhB/YbcL family Raf kinase inhibitor-like protein [candidate division KSB1 bacterium]